MGIQKKKLFGLGHHTDATNEPIGVESDYILQASTIFDLFTIKIYQLIVSVTRSEDFNNKKLKILTKIYLRGINSHLIETNLNY